MITVATLRPLEFWPETRSHGGKLIGSYISCHGEPFALPAGTPCTTIVEGPCGRWLARANEVCAFRILGRDEYKEVV